MFCEIVIRSSDNKHVLKERDGHFINKDFWYYKEEDKKEKCYVVVETHTGRMLGKTLKYDDMFILLRDKKQKYVSIKNHPTYLSYRKEFNDLLQILLGDKESPANVAKKANRLF